MPLTGDAKKVMASMVEQYGPEKGKQVFYATANKQEREERTWQKKSCFVPGKKAALYVPGARQLARIPGAEAGSDFFVHHPVLGTAGIAAASMVPSALLLAALRSSPTMYGSPTGRWDLPEPEAPLLPESPSSIFVQGPDALLEAAKISCVKRVAVSNFVQGKLACRLSETRKGKRALALAKRRNPDEFERNFQAGLKVEKEHGEENARKTTLDHMAENVFYYDEFAKVVDKLEGKAAAATFDPNDPYHRQWAEEGADAAAQHATRLHRDMRYDEALQQEPLRNMLGITGGMLFGAGLGELGNVAFQPTLPHEAAIAAGGLLGAPAGWLLARMTRAGRLNRAQTQADAEAAEFVRGHSTTPYVDMAPVYGPAGPRTQPYSVDMSTYPDITAKPISMDQYRSAPPYNLPVMGSSFVPGKTSAVTLPATPALPPGRYVALKDINLQGQIHFTREQQQRAQWNPVKPGHPQEPTERYAKPFVQGQVRK
jgi:hypothetical protein